MPLEKLQKRILDDAGIKADELEDEAEKQAEAIIRHARENVRRAEEMAGREVDGEIARAEQEQRANIELQKEGILLGARERVIEKLMPRIKSMTIKRIRVSGYERLINLAVAEAGMMAPQEELVLMINKKDAKLVRNFSGKIKYGNVENGVEIYTKNGKIKISTTIGSLFEKNVTEIKTAIIKEVFQNSAVKKRIVSKIKTKKRMMVKKKKRR